jgi:hypothetical protein
MKTEVPCYFEMLVTTYQTSQHHHIPADGNLHNNYHHENLNLQQVCLFKSTIFWDITPGSPLKVDWRFGGTCHLHLQGEISQATNKCDNRESASKLYLALLIQIQRWHVPPKHQLTFNGLPSVISQKIVTLHNQCCENLISYKVCLFFDMPSPWPVLYVL